MTSTQTLISTRNIIIASNEDPAQESPRRNVNKSNNNIHQLHDIQFNDELKEEIQDLENPPPDIVFQGDPKYEFSFTTVVLGYKFCGKSSILQRYCNNVFDTSYLKNTIGLEFFQKKIRWSQDCVINHNFLDAMGDERFKPMNIGYLRKANVAILVADYDSLEGTLEKAIKFKEDCIFGQEIMIVLFINKVDRQFSAEDFKRKDAYVRHVTNKHPDILKYFFTSALNGYGITEAMNFINNEMYKTREFRNSPSSLHSSVESNSSSGSNNSSSNSINKKNNNIFQIFKSSNGVDHDGKSRSNNEPISLHSDNNNNRNNNKKSICSC
ncbi:hypothetical protein CYY_001555 [Polysphondylium violaceum]|uniref:Rab GTPase n=1 Tax=Polysphondylium violaceum TaxID=133409 RepID=A0A8J4Q1S3_9MYCE|nr:hypothetical protein CYY_001555 [Polysphondylium violaceum]